MINMKEKKLSPRDQKRNPLEIHFRAGFGYGDYITNLAYAHNASIKYQTPVVATFHWNHDLNHLHSPDDPETIIERFWKTYNELDHLDDVSIRVKSNSNVDFRFINNLDHDVPFHGIWRTAKRSDNNNKNNNDLRRRHRSFNILLWRSTFNTYFPGADKDPISDHWGHLIDYLIKKEGHRVQEVTYRTPIDRILSSIEQCDMGIGYDGMVHQLFKCYHKPLLVFCRRYGLNRLLVPHAALENNYSKFLENGVDHYRMISERNLKTVMQKYHEWLYDHQDYKAHELFQKKVF